MKEKIGSEPINNSYSFLEKHPIIPNLSIYNAISLLSRFYRNVEAIDCLDLTVSYDEMINDSITMSKALKELGIKTIQDLANYNEKTLRKYFKNQAQVMIDKANGIDNSNVNSKEVEQKGIGNEFTLNFDTSNKEIINNNLIMLSEMTGLRLRKQKKYATTIVVNIKTSDFLRKSHQKKLDIPTNNTEEILKTSKEIWRSWNTY